METTSEKKFAYGFNFYKLFWIFVIGSLIGAVTETFYCRFSMGRWMSRSSLLYGPFSIVWGLGAVLLTIVLHQLKNSKDLTVFMSGALLGGGYEYLCSVFTERVLGTSFWNYDKIPLNVNGRINLAFCLFWGAMALGWSKWAYPRISSGIEKLPVRSGRYLTWLLLLLLIINCILSASAIIRTVERRYQVPPESAYSRFLDEHYPDEWMAHRYQNMKLVK